MAIQSQEEGEVSMSAESFALEHTPTWAVAAVCVVFIALSLLMQRGLQRLGTVSLILILSPILMIPSNFGYEEILTASPFRCIKQSVGYIYSVRSESASLLSESESVSLC